MDTVNDILKLAYTEVDWYVRTNCLIFWNFERQLLN